jgi:pimeloyl-ACP methyl ester carboxylesterase
MLVDPRTPESGMTRNTSRAKRWAKRIAIGVGSVAALVVITGASVEAVTRWRSARRFPAPGRLVDVGGRRLHLDCRGAGSPTVVLEAGLDYLGSLSWSAVHDSLARTTRVCAYSRAGVMWSDPAAGAFDVERNARDLHTALTNAGERAPWVMVGHSLGGPYVLVFTKLHAAEVRGLVLVDASHPEQFARFQEATGKTLQPPTELLAVGSTLAWTGLAKLAPLGGAPATWPAVAVEVPRAFFSRSIGALYEETRAIDATIAAERGATQLGDRPLVVLTAGLGANPDAVAQMGISAEQEARRRVAWLALQEDEATWSRASRHEVVPDASHYIQFDRPDVVIRAVREVVSHLRR